MYYIPFCEDLQKSMAGTINGVFDFVGIRDYLNINFSGPPVSEVHTIDIGITSVAGHYRYQLHNGDISDPLAFNAGEITRLAVINNMRTVKEKGYTAIASPDNLNTNM